MQRLWSWLSGGEKTAKPKMKMKSEYMLAKEEDEYGMAERIAWGKNEPPITRDLIMAFGGRGFLFNFRMWSSRVGKNPCEHVPQDDYYRKRFEALVESGMAEQGPSISLEERLQGLRIKDMRQFAKDIGVAEKFKSKFQGAAIIAKHPDANEVFSAEYPPSDFFKLKAWPGYEQERFDDAWAAYEKQAVKAIREKRDAYGMDDSDEWD